MIGIMLKSNLLTLVTLCLLSELGEIDGILTRLCGHLGRESGLGDAYKYAIEYASTHCGC